MLKTARSYYKKEINVFSIIRMRRYLMRAIKEVIPRPKRAEIRHHTKFSQIIADAKGFPTLSRSLT